MRTHGTPSCYRNGCRCDECRAANARKAKTLRLQRIATNKAPAKHGESGYSNYGCRCQVCSAAYAERNRQTHESATQRAAERAALGLEPPEHGVAGYRDYGCRCKTCTRAVYQVNAKRQAAAQARSRDAAHRHRAEWTGPELELLTRTDLSTSQISSMLGRTIAAVRTMRHHLSVRPREQWLAGQRARLH